MSHTTRTLWCGTAAAALIAAAAALPPSAEAQEYRYGRGHDAPYAYGGDYDGRSPYGGDYDGRTPYGGDWRYNRGYRPYGYGRGYGEYRPGDYYRGDRYRDDRYRDSYRGDRYYRGDYVGPNTRIWRGRDNRYYCRRDNGTTGLLIGGAAGAVIGSEVAGRGGDRTLGALLGGLGGALLGREIDRSDYRCR